jgi:DNA repair exonuclease SbcCD ATPase subunit
MTAEETAELMDSVATNTAEPNHAAAFLYNAAGVVDIIKAGARHSKTDMERIQKMHDTLCELGAACHADEDEDTDKVAKALAEREAEVTELRKVLDQVTPLTAAVAELGETIDDLRKTVGAQADEITKLKAEPAPPKTAANLHAVEKGRDGGAIVDENDDEMLKRLSEMSEDDRTVLLIKAARRNPIPLRVAK